MQIELDRIKAALGDAHSETVGSIEFTVGTLHRRKVVCAVCGVGIFALALTTALGYSVLHFQPFAPGTAWLDFWDFVVSNNVLPLGSLVLALFCCNRFGWGWDNFVAEANTGKGLKVRPWMKPIFRYFVPAAILFI